MRTLHELYLLLWEEIKDAHQLNDGICKWLFLTHCKGIFNSDEYECISRHFRYNKPKINMLYFPYYFPDGESGTQQRKDFVLKMIEITKPEFYYTANTSENAPESLKEAINDMAKKAYDNLK